MNQTLRLSSTMFWSLCFNFGVSQMPRRFGENFDHQDKNPLHRLVKFTRKRSACPASGARKAESFVLCSGQVLVVKIAENACLACSGRTPVSRSLRSAGGSACCLCCGIAYSARLGRWARTRQCRREALAIADKVRFACLFALNKNNQQLATKKKECVHL